MYMYIYHIVGRILRVQTFVKMPTEAPENFLTVLIFEAKHCIVQYQLGC